MNDINIEIENILSALKSSEGIKMRRLALNKFLNELPNIPNESLTALYEPALESLFSNICDKDEVIRENTADILIFGIPKLPLNNKYVDNLIPVLLYRLGDPRNNETSEELRLKLVQLLHEVLKQYKENIDLYCEDIIQILSVTLADPHAHVRRESCSCCVEMCNQASESMYSQSYKLVKPILMNFKHNQFRTRLCAIEALCAVLRDGNWKSVDSQLVFGNLGERLFDVTPQTRLGVVELLGDWFLRMRDRYSFFSRLIPLMLSCLTDEQESVSVRAWEVWESAGKQYLTENEQDLKDKMDFLDGKLEHYPKNVRRPNLGCRTLVHRNMCQITTPLLHELNDWKAEIREKAAGLLVILILHAEQDITQHSENFLLSMYSIAEKGDPACVIKNIEKGAEYMAYFVPPRVWHELVVPIVEQEVKLGHLRIISALFRGSQSNHLKDYLEEFIDIFLLPSVCCSRQPIYQVQLFKCCRALLDNIDLLQSSVEVNKIYRCLVRAAAVCAESAELTLVAQDCLQLLAKKTDLTYLELVSQNVSSVLREIMETVELWTSAHPDFDVMIYILNQPETTWGPLEKDVMKILEVALRQDMDARIRSRLFVQLAKTVSLDGLEEQLNEDEYMAFIKRTIEGLILPNLSWRAGRTAEAIRTTALACLTEVLIKLKKKSAHIDNLEELLPHLRACLQDEAPTSRELSLESIKCVVELLSKDSEFTADHFNATYREVLGRLDDVMDKVRHSAIKCITALLTCLPLEYKEDAYRPHFENILQIVLTHLDDPEEEIQLKILDVIKLIGRKAPHCSRDVIEGRKNLFRAKDLCELVLKELDV